MLANLKEYFPNLVFLIVLLGAIWAGYSGYQSWEAKKAQEANAAAEKTRQEAEEIEKQKIEDERRIAERRQAEEAERLRALRETALKAELQRKAIEEERQRKEVEAKVREQARQEMLTQQAEEEAAHIAEEQRRLKEADAASESTRRKLEAQLAKDLENWLFNLKVIIRSERPKELPGPGFELGAGLDFANELDVSQVNKLETVLKLCEAVVTQPQKTDVDAVVADAEIFKAQRIKELYTTDLLNGLWGALARLCLSTQNSLDKAINVHKTSVFRIQGNHKRMSVIYQKYKEYRAGHGQTIAGDENRGYGFRTDNSDELNRFAREFNALYEETRKLLIALEAKKDDCVTWKTQLSVVQGAKEICANRLIELGVQPGKDVEVKKEQAPSVPCTIYVLKDGRRIRAVSVMDAGDLIAIKDDAGKIYSIAKEEIVESIKE